MVNNKLGPLKVLIAEDNEINKLIAKTMLNRWGFMTTIAKDGEEAVMEVTRNDFDFILMDIQMPNKDGISATKDIREMPNPAKNSLPIIALTANAQIGVNNKYIDLGMDGYLSKPFKEEELYNLIELVLEKRKTPL
jgi:CheY-like chemotaxis protein